MAISAPSVAIIIAVVTAAATTADRLPCEARQSESSTSGAQAIASR